MTTSSQKRSTRNQRTRLDKRGLARFKVVGLDSDRDLIRALARRLAEASPDAKRLRAALAFDYSDEIEIDAIDQRKLAVARQAGRAELINRLRAFRGRLPADFKFDRNEANAR